MTPAELELIRARQRSRARAMAIVLAGLAVLFFCITIAKLGLQ